MRPTAVVSSFSALLAFHAITPAGFAQSAEMPRWERWMTSGQDKTLPLRPKAEKGDAKAQFALGFLYLFGDSYSQLEANQVEGMLWIRKSAAQGDAHAQDLMGCLLYQGRILQEDKAEAVKWFRLAAEQGDAYAQSNLGYCYYKGEGVAKDSFEAARWFRLAASKGEVKAQQHLGRILEAGEGVPKDHSEAAKWFFNLALQKEEADRYFPSEDSPGRAASSGSNEVQPASSWLKAAADGDTRAQYELGRCHDNGVGVASDPREAMKWYRRSAQGGYAPAQFILGYFHEWAREVQYDHDEVVKWYGKAADQGYAKAQYNLGCYYGRGEVEVGKAVPGQDSFVWSKIGIPKNPVEALKWYRKAAESGHPQAQYLMGRGYHTGKGVPKDQTEAFKWWLKAAEQGHATSQFNLGVMFFRGRGTSQDFSEAARWFKVRSMQKEVHVFFCGTGKPSPRLMVDGIQTPLVPLRDILEER